MPSDEVAKQPGSTTTVREDSRYLFKFIVLTQTCVYLECGAVPALLYVLKQPNRFNLDFIEQGMLGGAIYLWLSVACPIAGYTLRNWNVKRVLAATLTLNNLAIIGFAASPDHMASVLIASRSVVGFTQAFVMVYSPVWVDDFAPEESRTAWMSLVQASVPIGIMLGYACAYASMAFGECALFDCWRWPFAVQAVLVTPICIGAWFVNKEHLSLHLPPPEEHNHFASMQARLHEDEGFASPRPNKTHQTSASPPVGPTTPPLASTASLDQPQAITDEEKRLRRTSLADRLPPLSLNSAFIFEDAEETMEDSPRSVTSVATVTLTRSVRQTVGLVLNPVFIYTVMCLSALYFVVTGVQFWGTDYLLSAHPNVSKNLVMGLYISTSATAPLIGLVFGGWYVDKKGGYRGLKERARALRICLGFGLLAVTCATPATFVPGPNSLWVFIVCIWGLLFWGGALLPAATGIFISAVPLDLRAFASSMSVIAFNLFGYCAAPLLSSAVMQATGSQLWGMRLVLGWSAVAVGFMIGACVHAHHIANDPAWAQQRDHETSVGPDIEVSLPSLPPSESLKDRLIS